LRLIFSKIELLPIERFKFLISSSYFSIFYPFIFLFLEQRLSRLLD
jgi:hypothetical protein